MQVAPVLQKIVEAYDCNLVEGVFTHEIKQFVIDGNKCVLNKPSPEAKVAEGTFEENEVYAVDIVVSTGDGKTRILDEKETSVRIKAFNHYNLLVIFSCFDLVLCNLCGQLKAFCFESCRPRLLLISFGLHKNGPHFSIRHIFIGLIQDH